MPSFQYLGDCVMKILAVTMCILAVAVGVANRQDLDFTELHPKSAVWSQSILPDRGAGWLSSSSIPPPIKVQRKFRRAMQVDRIKERPRRSS
jgi:hypothetical protein